MLILDKMLLIGSERKNAGKTTLACKLIKKFCADCSIVAIKITTISENDLNHNHKSMIENNRMLWKKSYTIFEEKDAGGETDTSKFLAAGAKQSYWLRIYNENLLEGFTSLYKKIGDEVVIICESTSLIKLVKPGIFIMVTSGFGSSKPKKYIHDIKKHAHNMIPFDARNPEAFIDTIEVKSGNWKFTNRP